MDAAVLAFVTLSLNRDEPGGDKRRKQSWRERVGGVEGASETESRIDESRTYRTNYKQSRPGLEEQTTSEKERWLQTGRKREEPFTVTRKGVGNGGGGCRVTSYLVCNSRFIRSAMPQVPSSSTTIEETSSSIRE